MIVSQPRSRMTIPATQVGITVTSTGIGRSRLIEVQRQADRGRPGAVGGLLVALAVDPTPQRAQQRLNPDQRGDDRGLGEHEGDP